jgi:hypothetical protein
MNSFNIHITSSIQRANPQPPRDPMALMIYARKSVPICVLVMGCSIRLAVDKDIFNPPASRPLPLAPALEPVECNDVFEPDRAKRAPSGAPALLAAPSPRADPDCDATRGVVFLLPRALPRALPEALTVVTAAPKRGLGPADGTPPACCCCGCCCCCC